MRWLVLALQRVHALVWGLAVGVAIYLSLETATAHLLGGLCVDCWVSAVDGNDVLGAVGAAGTSVGTKAAKDFIENKARKTPFFSWLDIYDIASKDTPEGQAEEAWKKYKSLIMTEHAPEGSAGDEINKAIDRFFGFSRGDISVGGEDASRDLSLTGLWRKFLAKGPFDVAIRVVAVAAWIYLMFRTGGSLFRISVWSVPFVLMIAAVSTPWRSIKWRTVASFFMIGFGPVFLLTALVAWGLDAAGVEDMIRRWLNSMATSGLDLRLHDVRADVIAPVLEELFKVLPLLLIFWWRRSGFRTSAGPLDYASARRCHRSRPRLRRGHIRPPVSGAERPDVEHLRVGAGPDLCRPGRRRSSRVRFHRTLPVRRHRRLLLPRDAGDPGNGLERPWRPGPGDGPCSGVGGLVVPENGNRWFYLVPVAVLVWTMVEHMLANWFGGSGCGSRPSPLCTVASIGLHGRVFPVVVLAGWGYAIWVSGRHLREFRTIDEDLALPKGSVDRSTYPSGWRGWIGLWGDRFDFYRLRRKTAYGAFHLQARKVTRGQAASVLATRLEALLARQRLEGSPTTLLDGETRAMIDRVAPIP